MHCTRLAPGRLAPASSRTVLAAPASAIIRSQHQRKAFSSTQCQPSKVCKSFSASLGLPALGTSSFMRRSAARPVLTRAAYADESGEWLRNDDLELYKVPAQIRESVQNAMEALGYKATVGDVAARAGVSLREAERAMQALSADVHGTLQVSEDGDILYAIPRNFRNALLKRSAWLRIEPLLKGAQRFTAYMTRIVFGTTLIASILIVWVTLIALMTASSSSNDRDRNRGGDNGMLYYSMRSMGDLFWYWDPYYVRHPHSVSRGAAQGARRGSRGAREEQQGMGFMEGIFSFVFGDGDPNADIAEKRWQLVGQYIQSRGGVVAAEEIAPYLDLDRTESSYDELYGDEAYMMPVLLRFGGVPMTDSAGNVLYKFPDLQITGRQKVPNPPAERALIEETWKQTNADGLQVAASVGLGLINFVGIAALGSVLQNPQAQYALATSSLGWVGGLLPFLSVYAVAFFAIPFFRYFQGIPRNAAINKRNEARKGFLRQLAQPANKLQQKLTSARRLGSVTKVEDRKTIFTTDKSVEEQAGRDEFDEFDRKLGGNQEVAREARGQLGTGVSDTSVPVSREDDNDWRSQVLKRRQQEKQRRDWG